MAVIRLPLPMASAAAAALVLLAVSTRPLPATAHGYLSKPISRNYLTSEEFNPGGSLGVPNEPCISCESACMVFVIPYILLKRSRSMLCEGTCDK